MVQAYRNLLGDSWSRLPPGVQLALTPPLTAAGTFEIERAKRGVAGLLTALVPLPPEGPAVATSLSVRSEGDRLVWSRRFGTMNAVSRQWVHGNRIRESAAVIQLELMVREEGGAVVIEQTGLFLFGLPLPKFLGPTTFARLSAGSDEVSWNVEVTIGHPWFGPLTSYRGQMRTQDT